ncbi:MAG: oligosaccharide flippase family protein [Clostridium sp.]|nr:oligosaccharide flippase family protein [Clostridium sp.]
MGTDNQQTIVKRLVSGSFWSLTGSVLSKCLVLLSTFVITHLLTQYEYGRVGLVRTTIQTFASLLGLGMGATAAKFISQYRKENFLEAFKMYLVSNSFAWGVGIVACVCVVVSAPWLAEYSMHDGTLSGELRLSGLILLCCIINGAQQGVLAGFEDFKGIAMANLLMGVCEMVFLSLGAYCGGTIGTIGGFGMTYFSVLIFNALRIRRHITYSKMEILNAIRQLSRNDFKVIRTYSLPVALTSLVCMPALWWSKTYLTQKAGYEALAVFDVADQWRTQILFIPSMVASVLLPILAGASHKDDIKKVLKFNLLINVAVTVCFSGLVFLMKDFIMQLYGNTYSNSTPLFILSLTAVLMSLTNVMGTFFFALGMPMKVLLCNIILGVSIVLFSYYWVSELKNENGLAYANLCAYMVFTFCLAVNTYVRMKKL